ncbi:MAG: DUF4962 domain-containing protein [Armatimonadetes bacterium]|nr:DUF4962 domain-containing protein [Armatimonadota bacterium]
MGHWLVGPALIVCASALALDLDERPRGAGEWGYRPEPGSAAETTPPGFVWRPTRGVATWELEVGRGDDFEAVVYRAEKLRYNVHCPPEAFPPGSYTWRYRGTGADGETTAWSQARTFTVRPGTPELPLPPRDELLARIPTEHPRLFIRPEQLDSLRRRIDGDLKPQYDGLAAECKKLVAAPPPTAEPPKYPDGTVRGSDPWRAVWWGNREYTSRALNGAATLAFCWRLDGNEAYGQLARRILVDCLHWDPVGATGYRYNDEAGMPYNWGVSRTYTFVHPLLTEDERALARRVMKVRGDEMYRHLYPKQFWTPYDSHANRAWHKLGEIGIAFLGEVEGADEWVWFAVNEFFNTYPVWSDDDGGWHEGVSYWSSYQSRFTWWADVMRAAMGIDAYHKPYFAKVGYYPMYLLPPNTADGGFGDLTENVKSRSYANLVANFAAQAGNGHWQWWVAQHGDPAQFRDAGYVGFVRGARQPVAPTPPTDLPTSRLFRGIGQAMLNTTLEDGNQNVQVLFKSSPFGSQSHGYEAQNSFLLWAYGQRLLIRTGRRDSYGSEHHAKWMWSTRSVNNLTVDGVGQRSHSAGSRGEVTAFITTPSLDAVAGEAGNTYRQTREGKDSPLLRRFTRTVLFAKPELVVIYDRVAADEAHRCEYWLHALNRIETPDQHSLLVSAGEVRCAIDFLTPAGLTFRQTDQYDPNPRERVTVREWHLTATAEPREQVEFVTLYRPYRAGQEPPRDATLTPLDGGYALRVKLTDGELAALLPRRDDAKLAAVGLETTGVVAAERRDPAGRARDRVRLDRLP